MKDIISANGNMYQLVRTITENKLNNPDTNILKEWFNCDTVLRKQGILYFCRIIKEIEYEDITN